MSYAILAVVAFCIGWGQGRKSIQRDVSEAAGFLASLVKGGKK